MLQVLQIFVGAFGDKKDFSGFQDRASWPKRDKVSHKRNCEKLQIARANQSTTGNHENLEFTTVPYANLNTLTVLIFTSLTRCIIYFLELQNMSSSYG